MANPVRESTTNLALVVTELRAAEEIRLAHEHSLTNIDRSVFDLLEKEGPNNFHPETIIANDLIIAHNQALQEVKDAFDRVQEQFWMLQGNMQAQHRPHVFEYKEWPR